MNPFELGAAAYHAGVSRFDNPLDASTMAGAAWDHGWLDALFNVLLAERHPATVRARR